MLNRTPWRIAVLSLTVFLLLTGESCWENPCSPTDPACGGSASPTYDRLLPVPLVRQQTQVWCWAATSEMIFRYYSLPITQCQLVSVYLNQECCTGNPFCAVPSGTMDTIQRGLFLVGGVRSTWAPGPLSFDQVAAEIDAGRPIMIGYRGSFSGHVVMLTGYARATRYVKILDPYYGAFDVPYGSSLVYNGQFLWTDTLVGITR